VKVYVFHDAFEDTCGSWRFSRGGKRP
jgi:hypothetical protein